MHGLVTHYCIAKSGPVKTICDCCLTYGIHAGHFQVILRLFDPGWGLDIYSFRTLNPQLDCLVGGTAWL